MERGKEEMDEERHIFKTKMATVSNCLAQANEENAAQDFRQTKYIIVG
jgi:hypothetical protein